MEPIERQTVSLELAKEMEELGYPQEGLWWWHKYIHALYGDPSVEYKWCLTRWKPKYGMSYVAPTVAELGEALPEQWGTPSKTEASGWCYSSWILELGEWCNIEQIDTEADARAKMWIYLKKAGLI